jgi:hypothetical protein
VKYTLLFIPLLFISHLSLKGQDKDEIQLFSSTKKLVYVELHGQYGTVFKLYRISDPGVSGLSIQYIDTLHKQSGPNGIVYEAERTSITAMGKDLYLEFKNAGSKKGNQLKLNYPDSIETAYREINNAWWFDIFEKLSVEINSRFKWQHYSFRGYQNIDLGGNDRLPFQSFKTFADNRINMLRDSLVAVNSSYTSITDELINNIGNIEYGHLKMKLAELGESPGGSGYFNAVIQSVCESRPEWFYQLAEDIPTKKEILFNSVYGHALVKKLKKVKTDSPAKEEFIKHKRRDRRFTFGAIGAAVAGAALLGFSLLVLIK